jgi:branched-subunit amino acid aminotransferase/4-amino-4-deoxychorismate lyase
MNPLPLIPPGEFLRAAAATRRPFHAAYYAMYSSVLGGIVTDPTLMWLPADDHLAHRGDGVFETFKCIAGRLYNLPAHLERLDHSARCIGLGLPWDRATLTEIVRQTVRAGGRRDCLVRLLASRGPGSFGISPRDCPQPAVYVIVYELKPPFMQAHPGGARACPSDVPIKPRLLATIKSVNYLPNVLMKRQAIEADADFAIGFDERGCLAEGATENVGMVDAQRVLRVPKPDRILAGTTLRRVLDLAPQAVGAGALASVEEADIPRPALAEAAEILVFGTTPDVTAVTVWDRRPVGDGRPGPAYRALSRLLAEDLAGNDRLLTPVF